MSYEFILTEKHELVRLVRLNRPALRNALDAALIDEPGSVVDAFEADGTVGAIVVTGNDPRRSWSRRQFFQSEKTSSTLVGSPMNFV